MVVSMDSVERSSECWMAEAVRAKEIAVKMKSPLAKMGMERIAECYEGFARRAKGLALSARPSLSRGSPPMAVYKATERP
jgi:hypothetical protein